MKVCRGGHCTLAWLSLCSWDVAQGRGKHLWVQPQHRHPSPLPPGSESEDKTRAEEWEQQGCCSSCPVATFYCSRILMPWTVLRLSALDLSSHLLYREFDLTCIYKIEHVDSVAYFKHQRSPKGNKFHEGWACWSSGPVFQLCQPMPQDNRLAKVCPSWRL